MARERNPLQMPRTGLEIAPLAGLTALPFSSGTGTSGTPATGGGHLLSRSTLGAVLVYAAYQALLSGLRTETLVQGGQLSRPTQARIIAASVWRSMQDGAAIGLVLSLVLLVCPWLALPLGVLGAVGVGKASLDLFHAFWDGLDDRQKLDLHQAAYGAGVDLQRLLRRRFLPVLKG